MMFIEKARLKAIAFSLLKYYGVVICAFLVALPVTIMVMVVSIYLSDLVTSPETFTVLMPLVVGIVCTIIGLPVVILGGLGLFFLLFFKWKKKMPWKQEPQVMYGPPTGYGHHYYQQPQQGWGDPRFRQPPGRYPPPHYFPPPPGDYYDETQEEHRAPGGRSPPRDETLSEKEVKKPIQLPSAWVSFFILIGLILICMVSYVAVVLGIFFFNMITLVFLILGLLVLLLAFPFMFTYPPIMWIQALQKKKNLIVPEKTILKGLTWGICSPALVMILIIPLDLVYFGLTGNVVPDWVGVAITAPVVEEFAKAFGLALLFSRIRNQYDGLLIGFSMGVGFAVIENLLYFASTGIEGLGSSIGGAIIGWIFVVGVRSFQSTLSHGLGTAIIGFSLGWFIKGLKEKKMLWYLPVLGYLAAVFIHFAWNGAIVFMGAFFTETILVGLLFLIWMIFFFLGEFFLLFALRYWAKKLEEVDMMRLRDKRRLSKRRSGRRKRRPSITV